MSDTLTSKAVSLLQSLAVRGVEARRLTTDSRTVTKGDIFLAYPGHYADGRVYIDDAVARGAAVVLFEPYAASDMDRARLIENVLTHARKAGVVCEPIENLVALAGELAHQLCDRPSEKIWLAGVTGTNGKTSVSQWLLQALTHMGQRCAVVGTLGNGFMGDLQETGYTTPDVLQLHTALSGFVHQGATACVMEVSSIGLAEGRVQGVRFDVAIFTNLTRDHLDYHGTMDAYGEAKTQLFANPWIRAAVLNLDDVFSPVLAQAVRPGVRVIGYTLNAANVVAAQAALLSAAPGVTAVDILVAGNLQMTTTGLTFEVNGQLFSVPVVGRFNASNLMAVIAALVAKGEPLDRIAIALKQLQPAPGRMQPVGGEAEPLVIVDYAHTPDALENILAVSRELATVRGGQLVCVFGCGGNRDAGKRPVMGSIAERLADRVIVTSDNPRDENPQQIIQAILAGMLRPASVIEQRGLAITESITQADARDVIVLAGKGHEAYQEIAGVREAFNDVDAAKSALVIRRQAGREVKNSMSIQQLPGIDQGEAFPAPSGRVRK